VCEFSLCGFFSPLFFFLTLLVRLLLIENPVRVFFWGWFPNFSGDLTRTQFSYNNPTTILHLLFQTNRGLHPPFFPLSPFPFTSCRNPQRFSSVSQHPSGLPFSSVPLSTTHTTPSCTSLVLCPRFSLEQNDSSSCPFPRQPPRNFFPLESRPSYFVFKLYPVLP